MSFYYNDGFYNPSPSSSSSSSVGFENPPDNPSFPGSSSSISSASSTTINGDTVPITAGLALWLRGDRNVTGSYVSRWGDFRGVPAAAVQAMAERRPLLVPGAIAGQYDLHFGGASALVFDPAISAIGEFTIFVHATPATFRTQSDGTPYPQPALFVGNETTGVTYANIVAGLDGGAIFEQTLPASPVLTTPASDRLCPLTVRYHAGSRMVFLNGALVASASGGAAAIARVAPWLGGPDGGLPGIYSFQGSITEVLIYDRALSDAERILVETYFQLRYPDNSNPPPPLTGSSTHASPSAESSSSLGDVPAAPSGNSSGGPLPSSSMAPVQDSSSSAEESGNSSESISSQLSSSLSPESIPDGVPVTDGLQVWLRADRHVTYDINDRVSRWSDARGLPPAGAQSASQRQPLWIANALGSRDAIRFGGQTELTLSSANFDCNEFSLFVIAAPTAQPVTPTSASPDSQPLLFGGVSDQPELIVAASIADLDFYDSTGARPLLNHISLSTPALCPLAIIWHANGLGEVHINGGPDPQDMLAPDGEIIHAPSAIGGAPIAAQTIGFSGDIAEILIYDRALTDGERIAVETYLQARYDFLPQSSRAGSPSASSESYPLMSSSSLESSSSESFFSSPGQFAPPPFDISSSQGDSSSSSSDSSSSSSSISSYEIPEAISSVSGSSSSPTPTASVSINYAAGSNIDLPVSYVPIFLPNNGTGKGAPVSTAPTGGVDLGISISFSDNSASPASISVLVLDACTTYMNTLPKTSLDPLTFASADMSITLLDYTPGAGSLNIKLDCESEGVANASMTLAYSGGKYSNVAAPTPTDAPPSEVEDFAGFYISVEVSERMNGTVNLSAKSGGDYLPMGEVTLMQIDEHHLRSEKLLVLTTDNADIGQMTAADQETYQALRWPDGADVGFSKGGGMLKVQFVPDSDAQKATAIVRVQGPAIILQSLDFETKTGQVSTVDRIVKPLKALGYTTFTDLNASTAKTLGDYVKGKQIWYSMSHGLFPEGGLPSLGNQLQGLSFVDNKGSTPAELLAGAIKTSDLTPLQLDYRLVIVDGCASAQTDDLSEITAQNSDDLWPNAKAFAQSFGPDVAYLGWGFVVNPAAAQQWTSDFLMELKLHQTVGSALITFRNVYAGVPASKLLKLYGKEDNTILP